MVHHNSFLKNYMPLNPRGSNPVVTANFGGIDFAGCKLFFKKQDETSFKTILIHDSSISGQFTRIIDPTEKELLGSGSNVSDLIGCEINWSVVFIDYDNTPPSAYSFILAIKQDGIDLLVPSYSKTGEIKDSSIIFGGRFIIN
jgi:hypothetical protein